MRSYVRAMIILGISGAAACVAHDIRHRPDTQFGVKIAVFGIHVAYTED